MNEVWYYGGMLGVGAGVIYLAASLVLPGPVDRVSRRVTEILLGK